MKHTGRIVAVLVAACLACPMVANAATPEYEVRMPVEKTARISPLGEASGAESPEKAKALPQAAQKAAQKTPQAAPKTALGRAAEAAAASAAPPLETSASGAEQPSKPGKAVKAAKLHKSSGQSENRPEGQSAAPSETQAAAQPEAKHSAASGHAVVSAGAPIPVKIPAGPAAASTAGQSAPQPAPLPAAKVPAKAEAPASVVKPKPTPPPAPPLDPKALVAPAPAAAAAVALPADGLWVGGVDVEFKESAIVLRVATSGHVERVSWFNVAAPRKLALDLRGEWRKKGPAVLRFDTGPLKNIVVGEHPDRVRLSLEFRDGAVAAMVDPKIEPGDTGVTLTIPLAVRLSR